MRARGFTLIELLVVLAITGTLTGLMLPSLRTARDTARTARCATNQRQLVLAWAMYAGDHADRAHPHLGAGPGRVYWYGAEDHTLGRVDHERGTLTPYLDATIGARTVFECPVQPEGTYREQGAFGGFTTTYGYNAYALAPPSTGYTDLIGQRWLRTSDVARPSALFVYADTLIGLHAERASNSALLDPPSLFSKRRRVWNTNTAPTTAFRHARQDDGYGRAVVAHADGSVRMVQRDPEAVGHDGFGIGSAHGDNDPGYVPGWRRWR